tara:strand:- start:2495 stop:2695 length:201 start_codon:yes stop_codon:yes gene_type:complete
MEQNQTPSELIVEVFAVAVSDLMSLGFSKEQAVLGLLSQAAVQANSEAMIHATALHDKFHKEFALN